MKKLSSFQYVVGSNNKSTLTAAKFKKKKLFSLLQVKYTANVNRQSTEKLLFSYAIITGENV